MFESLKGGLQRALQIIRGYGSITEVNIGSAVTEIRKVLVQSDVDFKLAKELTEKIKSEAIGQKVLTSLHPSQVFTKIVNDKLIEFMSCGENKINFTLPYTTIMLVGLQGAGKTTFAAKLAVYLRDNFKKKPLVVACDVYRPAAIEQLQILSERNNINFFKKENEKKVMRIIEDGINFGTQNDNDVIILDTAGRQSIDEQMMNEIKEINSNFNINEKLLVLDSMIGQTSLNIAKSFNDAVGIDGYVLTKTDGDAHGGVALSVTAVTHKPIKFMSTGEKMGDIELFHADRMVNRILGKGDIVSLVEKIEQQCKAEEDLKKRKEIERGRFDYNTILYLEEKTNNMGGLMKVFEYLPVFKGFDEEKKQKGVSFFKRMAIVINSMTPKERADLCHFDLSRKVRIAKGAGVKVSEVELVISNFEKMKKLLPQLINGNPFRFIK